VRASLHAELGIASEDDLASFVTDDVSLGGLRAHGRLLVTPGEQVVVLLSGRDWNLSTLARVVDSTVFVREGRVELRLAFEHMTSARRARLATLLGSAARPSRDSSAVAMDDLATSQIP
jgi:hypothetical protein